jgi:hypothetical protein
MESVSLARMNKVGRPGEGALAAERMQREGAGPPRPPIHTCTYRVTHPPWDPQLFTSSTTYQTRLSDRSAGDTMANETSMDDS